MAVQSLVVTECGSGLVSAGLDGELNVWTCVGAPHGAPHALGTTTRSSQRWEHTFSQRGGGGEINSLALLDGMLACGCQDGSVPLFRMHKEEGCYMLYSLDRKQHTQSGSGHSSPRTDASPRSPFSTSHSEVMSVALSKAARASPLLASGAQDGSVCVWNCSSGALEQRIRAHGPSGAHHCWVMVLLLDRWPDEQHEGLMLTGSYDQTIKVWGHSAERHPAGLRDPSEWSGATRSHEGKWALQATLEGHRDGILSLALNRRRTLAYSGSNDRTVRVWSIPQGACLYISDEMGGGISALSWHLASGFLTTGSEDGIVRLWDTQHRNQRDLSQWNPSQPWSSGERMSRSQTPSGATMSLVQSMTINGSDMTCAEVLCLAPSADGTALFCGLDDGSIALIAAA